MKKLTLLPGLFLLAAAGLMVMLSLTAAVPAENLPPRPATPTPDAAEEASALRGAFITLHAWNAPVDAWTVVQWQDALGGWHDVDGWRGHLDDSAGAEKRWWVAPEDFKTGPFRWLVYGEKGGELLGTSANFYLPSRSAEVVGVDVVLP